MREIKFRAILKKTIIYFTLSDLVENLIDGSPRFSIRELLIPWIRERNKPDMYTGLKDKDDKEIYGGDIIHGSLVLWEIIFEHGCFIGINERGVKLELHNIENREIIGNKFDNPDLLEEK